MKLKLSKRIFASVLVFAMTVGIVTQYVMPVREVQAEAGKEPIYNEAACELKYSKDAIEVGAGKNYPFGVTISKEETCYMSFEVQSDTEVYFDFNGNTSLARMYLGQKQYGLINFEKDVWPQGDIGLSKGVKITYSQGPKGISLWLNGVKAQENLQPKEAVNAAPRVQWVQGAANLKNVKIWIVKEEVAVETDEPAYKEGTDKLEYSKDAIEIGAGKNYSFGVTIPNEETYCMSFEVQSDTEVYFDFSGNTSLARMYLGQKQYGLINFEKDVWSQGDIGLSKGIKVTYQQGSDGISIWFNGEKVQENLQPKEAGDGAPRVQWVKGAANLKNVKIWIVKEEPKYDAATQELKYSEETITVAANKDYPFGVRIPKEETYYMSFEVQSDTEIYFDFNGNTSLARMYLGQKQYGLINFEKDVWPQGDIGLSKGIKVTYQQGTDGISIWFNGEKVQENLQPKEAGDGAPRVQWVKGAANLKNVQIWTEKGNEPEPVVSDAPVYDPEKHMIHDVEGSTGGTYENGVLTVPAQSSGYFNTDLEVDADYYMSFVLKANKPVNISYRNSGGAINLQSSGYESTGTKEAWVNKGFSKFSTGLPVTLHSTPTQIQIWVDGEKIIDKNYTFTGASKPGISWSFTDVVTVSDIKIWTEKGNEPEPVVSDAPVYDSGKHVLHDIEGSTGGSYKDGVLTLEPESSGYFNTDLDGNADYYMSFILKSKKPVNISYRHPKGQINIQSSGFESTGTAGAWVSKNFSKLSKGLPVTVHSTPTWITIWVNGEKILDEAYTITGESRPGISWSFNDVVTVSDVTIWSEPDEGRKDFGEIITTQQSPLYVVKEYGVTLREEAEKKTYVDASPVGVNAQKSTAKGADAQSEIVASDMKTQGLKFDLAKASVPIAGAVIMLAVVVAQIVRRKKIQ